MIDPRADIGACGGTRAGVMGDTRQKAEGRRQKWLRQAARSCVSAEHFCLLPSAFCPSTTRRLRPRVRTNRILVTLSILCALNIASPAASLARDDRGLVMAWEQDQKIAVARLDE